MINPINLQYQIRNLTLLFIITLALSGITAFFVETGLAFLLDYFNFGPLINSWLYKVHFVLAELNETQPFTS